MASTAGTRVNALVLTFTLIPGIVVFFRLLTRSVILRHIGWEDGCIALATLFSVGFAVAIAIQVQNGMGRHFVELNDEEKITIGKAFWAGIWLDGLSLTLTKVSILLQYRQLLPHRGFRLACSALAGIIAIYGTWILFGGIFTCTPVSFFWDRSISGGRCLNQFAVVFINGTVDIVQNFMILGLPMPLFRRLQLPKEQKRIVLAVFALGGFLCIASILRLRSTTVLSGSTDPTFDSPAAASWSVVETNLGIVVACLPTMRPLLSAMFPRTFPPPASQFTNGRGVDEEQPKHLRTFSEITRPTTAATQQPRFHAHTHSRNASNAHSRNATNAHSRNTSNAHSRNASNLANPLVSPISSHSRSHSNISNTLVSPLSDTAPQTIQAVLAARSKTPVRQIHIRSSSREPSLNRAGTPRPLRVPENVGGFAIYRDERPIQSVETVATFTIHRDDTQSRYSLDFSNPIPPPLFADRPTTRGRPITPRTPRLPVVQKPLPITPFPV